VDEGRALELSARWWDEVWRDGNVDVADEIFTDPFVRHTAIGTEITSVASYKRALGEFQRALCKPQTTIDDRVISGDRIWTRATSRGINRETGDPAIVTWLLVQRVVDGRIAEHWALTAGGVDWAG